MSRTFRALSAFATDHKFSVHALSWALSGLPTPPPPAIKRRRLVHQFSTYGLDTFVETGTFRGGTLAVFAKLGADCHSIELDPAHHAHAKQRFAQNNKVNLIQGNSGIELPKLLPKLKKPALFWLDGHFSGGSTASAATASPIVPEMDALLSWRHSANSIIMIDDVDEFTGENGYPPLGEFLGELEKRGPWAIAVNCGIIELTPKS